MYASVHTKHLLPAHISQLVRSARTLRISLSCLCWWQDPKGGCTTVWYNICRYLNWLCQSATHGRTQLHAVTERLSFGDNNWVCSPVSETPWLEPNVEAMCLCQTFVSGQYIRNDMIVANIPLVSPSFEPTTLDHDRWFTIIRVQEPCRGRARFFQKHGKQAKTYVFYAEFQGLSDAIIAF